MNDEQLQQNAQEWLYIRERGRRDLLFLANQILAPPDSRIIVRHAHGPILDHCQKFYGRIEEVDHRRASPYGVGIPTLVASEEQMPIGALPGTRDNLLLVSRGTLKTTINCIAHSIQWILNYPDVRILIATATDEKAQMIVKEIKGHFQFNPRFRFFYPEFCPPEKKVSDWGSSTEFTVPNRIRRAKEPTVMTAAVGKALASTHHDVVKCSDVETENNIGTQGQIAALHAFFGYLDPLREKFETKDGTPNPGWLDIEGTLYDFSGPHQVTLDKVRSGEWSWFKATHQSCWRDRDKKIPLWPERLGIQQLERIEKQIGPVLFAAQYELNPIPGGTGLASQEQIKFFPAHLIAELMPRYRVHTTVDLAGMDPQTEGDSTVFSTCGFDSDGRCDVLSIVKGRFTLDRVVDLFFAIDKVYPSNQSFKVQKDHFSRTIWPILQREQAKRGRFLNIILTPVSTRISKQQRIRGLQAWFLQGILRFADNISCKNDLILEILRFPKFEHDDILDTLADQMHNRDGGPSVDVYPDAPREVQLPWGQPQPQNRFVEFDPITHNAKWIQDAVESATPFYNSLTGAL